MPDGTLTALDNRVTSAREAGINVRANVRNFNDHCHQIWLTDLQLEREFRKLGVRQ